MNALLRKVARGLADESWIESLAIEFIKIDSLSNGDAIFVRRLSSCLSFSASALLVLQSAKDRIYPSLFRWTREGRMKEITRPSRVRARECPHGSLPLVIKSAKCSVY